MKARIFAWCIVFVICGAVAHYGVSNPFHAYLHPEALPTAVNLMPKLPQGCRDKDCAK